MRTGIYTNPNQLEIDFRQKSFIGQNDGLKIDFRETPHRGKKNEIIGYPFNIKQYMQRGLKIPNKQGIYHLFNETHLVYVGIAEDLSIRLQQHLNGIRCFTYCLWFITEGLEGEGKKYERARLENIERKIIRHYKPVFNMQYWQPKDEA